MEKLAVFDLDGTLYRALKNATNAVNRALVDIGYPTLTQEAVRGLLGTTTEEYCDLAIPGYEDRAGFFRLVKRYDIDEIAKAAPLFEGVEQMLDALQQADYRLAICSNGVMEYIRQVLDRAGILRRFALLESGADDCKQAALERILAGHRGFAFLAGDRKHDFAAAAAAGIPSIAACYGYGCEEEYAAAHLRAACPLEISRLALRLEASGLATQD